MRGLPITLNPRQRSIIYALLSADGRMTLKKLANQTGLTSRIVRYNLDTVKAWFRYEGVTLASRPGYGIEIDASRQKRKQLLQVISKSDVGDLILTRGQRQRATLFELLTADEPVTYQDLAANEGISRSTIVNDVSDMQRWLDPYELILRRTQNRGAFITGKEISRRYALLNLIRDELGERKWYSLWFNPDLKLILDKSLPLSFEEFLKSLPLEFSRNVVGHIENLLGKRLALYSRLEVLMYLAISVDAMQAGKFSRPDRQCKLKGCLELQISQFILSDIERNFNLKPPETESHLLAICLLGSKWEIHELEAAQPESYDELSQLGEESLDFANAIIRVCSSQLHPLLQVDQELALTLAHHLKPVIHRLRYNLPILNSCLENIQNQYPEVYRSAKAGVEIIERRLDKPVPPEEIGFVAMYLAAALNRLRTKDRTRYPVVILGDGIRAKLAFLKARLEYEFPTLEVIGMLSGFAINNRLLEQAELILSLIPNDVPGMTTMHVSPFLEAEDRRKIQNWISEKEEKLRKDLGRSSESAELIELLQPRTIVLEHSVSEWREMVRLASAPLIDLGYITRKYCDAMIKIIEDYGPYMMLAPGVIVLHARPVDGVKSLCLSMLMLEQGVVFNEQYGEVDIAFVLGAVDDHAHLNALFELNQLLEKEAFLADLRSSKNPADILRTIWAHATFNQTAGREKAMRELD